jgi:hypothetical protein
VRHVSKPLELLVVQHIGAEFVCLQAIHDLVEHELPQSPKCVCVCARVCVCVCVCVCTYAHAQSSSVTGLHGTSGLRCTHTRTHTSTQSLSHVPTHKLDQPEVVSNPAAFVAAALAQLHAHLVPDFAQSRAVCMCVCVFKHVSVYIYIYVCM